MHNRDEWDNLSLFDEPSQEDLAMPMSEIERSELVEYENIIDAGLQTFQDVGTALLRIREKGLYREHYRTFDEYFEKRWGARWGLHRSRAYQLMDAAQIASNISSVSTMVDMPLPNSERQSRPLRVLRDEKGNFDAAAQHEAWQRAIDTAPNGKITAGHVQRVVDDMMGKERTSERPAEYGPDFDDDYDTQEAYERSGMQRPAPAPQQQPSKPYHANSRSIGDQFHTKLLWNYERIDLTAFDHFTIGYSQRNWDQFLELLELAGVNMLMDVRRNPSSQYKPDFNKQNLMEACSRAGIAYYHASELGIPHEDRADLAETQDYDGLFDNYEQRITSGGILEAVVDRALIDAPNRIAFMCVELDPNTCHRCRIAKVMQDQLGFTTFDL